MSSNFDFYKGNEELIEFSAATAENPFGAQLLSLCEKYFEDLPTAVEALTEGLAELDFEVDVEGVVGLMTGEILPSEELLEALSEIGTEADARRLYSAAASAYDLASELLDEGEIEVDAEDEEYEDEDEDEDEDDSDYEDEDESDDDIEDESGLEVTEAVEQMYTRQIVSDRLNEFSEIADQMIEGGQGLMTPHIKNLLFGQSDKSRYVNFMAGCEEFDATPAEYLKCIEFSLNLLAELGGIDSDYFEPQVDTKIERSKVNFSASDEVLEREVSDMVDLLW